MLKIGVVQSVKASTHKLYYCEVDSLGVCYSLFHGSQKPVITVGNIS